MNNIFIFLQSFIATRWGNRFTTKDALLAFQEKKLIAHLAFLRRYSSYFAKLPPVTSLSQISNLPIMDKSIMMHHFNQMNTVGLDKDTALEIAINSEKSRDFNKMYNGVSVGLSSGTSGHRGLFIVSEQERYAWAGAVLAKYLPKGRLFGHRVAFFLRANNNLYETVGSRIIRFKYFDLYKDVNENITNLASFNPTILVAPPSMLGVIADKIEAGELSIEPQKIISVAEVLTEKDHNRFKKVFNKKTIFQAYQCTEGFLAYTCEKGSLHLNEDIVYIEKEYVDDKRFIPIITDFRRTSQPIIRYRLNDVLVESTTKCPCGSVMAVIDRIEGREDDIFLFKDKTGKFVKVFSDIMGRCLLYVKDIKEYRIVQTDYDKLDIYVDNTSMTAQKAITHEISHLAERLSCSPPMLTFKEYSYELGKKLKRIERKFTNEKR